MLTSQNYIAIPPGATIREQLEERGMSQKEFAARMEMSEKHISRLINGEVILTPQTAYKLELVLGLPASFWNKLEAQYREKAILVEQENSLEKDIEIAKKFPYSEMASYGWVEETRNIQNKVINLRKFFGVITLTLLGNNLITHIATRRLAVTEKSDLALMAWAQEAKIEARSINVGSIEITHLSKIIPEIKSMTLAKTEEFSPVLKNRLAECGVALVFLPHLKGSFLQGATFIDGKKIVIGVTARGKDKDKFWFSLFHELGHIMLGHIKKNSGISEEDERNADIFAENALIEKTHYDAFVKSRDYSKKSVISFAKGEGVATGIVVGRLQRDGIISYSSMNNLKEKLDFS